MHKGVIAVLVDTGLDETFADNRLSIKTSSGAATEAGESATSISSGNLRPGTGC